MEGRRSNKKKSSILGYMIVLCVFFFPLYVRCQLVSDGQKTLPLCIDRIADIPRRQ
jgi:hypothetical protein